MKSEKTLFDLDATNVKVVPPAEGKPSSPNPRQPYTLVFEDTSAIMKIFSKGGSVYLHTNVFAMGFPHHDLYKSCGRASADITDLDKAAKPEPVTKLLQSCAPTILDVASISKNVLEEAGILEKISTAFATLHLLAGAKNRTLSGSEPDNLASLKLQVTGSRKM